MELFKTNCAEEFNAQVTDFVRRHAGDGDGDGVDVEIKDEEWDLRGKEIKNPLFN
ncbi:hypothetical protein TRIUR3_25421 [Triticum urartu]|uniref:Uncharacterized protein n=1 Tax=Triticum urartu TaxID=4572 RepID=M7YM23_TRIUA|nr:hypothetical protein TRIUR3_25421 [Triticum urartu]